MKKLLPSYASIPINKVRYTRRDNNCRIDVNILLRLSSFYIFCSKAFKYKGYMSENIKYSFLMWFVFWYNYTRIVDYVTLIWKLIKKYFRARIQPRIRKRPYVAQTLSLSRMFRMYPLLDRKHKESYTADGAEQTCFIEIGLRNVRVAMTYTSYSFLLAQVLCISMLRLYCKGRSERIRESISTWPQNDKLGPPRPLRCP